MSSGASAEAIWNVPNALSFSRLFLTIGLCTAIAAEAWWVGFAIFCVAAFTDWLDGWWARRYNQGTILGRTLDPLVDKVLICGAFIYLLQVPGAGLQPWMVTVVVGREVFITGVRGYIEALGLKFGADLLGKLKMGLQCAWLIAVLLVLALVPIEMPTDLRRFLHGIQDGLLIAMLAATITSGVQYLWRAGKLIATTQKSQLPSATA